MMVAGLSRSGQMHWVAQLIKTRQDMIDSPVIITVRIDSKPVAK